MTRELAARSGDLEGVIRVISHEQHPLAPILPLHSGAELSARGTPAGRSTIGQRARHLHGFLTATLTSLQPAPRAAVEWSPFLDCARRAFRLAAMRRPNRGGSTPCKSSKPDPC